MGWEKIELGIGFVEEGRRMRNWFVDGIYDDTLLMGLNLRFRSPGS